jgi:hypothetical protein
MRWGFRPKNISPEDKRARCEASVTRKGKNEKCLRLARLTHVSYCGDVNGDHFLCNNHRAAWEKRGFTVTLVDRRKKAK